ncbi:transcriptional antiterminator [Streptococcus gallinaceus]|uniref:BglG family transcription antiterminator n=1 Tax=Streptococcus gallinaceus TaxID=165758 RepID=UPI00209DA2C4|nr:transcription antiterminator [Streptococcus gallinaceus]MCP1639556.1 transcriptional antiterminator [Streptococcus gallinaceus]MCP1770339.1 transcriptional antiterminator [Streptococcus gallinaceus]
MLLDKKSHELLLYLLKLESPETVMTISQALGQSRRKIYYHLDKVNDALPKDVAQIIAYPRVGVVLDEPQKEACRHLLAEVDDYSYVMNIDERLQLMQTYIAVSMERVTIDKLMQLTDVSRNTTLHDLSLIRDRLTEESYQLQLIATKSSGYLLEGHPLTKFQSLYYLLNTIYWQRSDHFWDFFQRKMEEFVAIESYFSRELVDFISNFLTQAQSQWGKKIGQQDKAFMQFSLPYILLSYRNMALDEDLKAAYLRDFNLILQRKEYEIAQQLRASLSDSFDFELDEIEVSIIAMLLLSFRKEKDSHLESRDYDEMRLMLGVFLDELTARYGLVFEHRSELLHQLLTHCKALLYRKTYGILSSNPLTDHIKEKYTELFEMTKACSEVLEEAWFIRLSDDDIAYLTIHLGGELRRSEYCPKAQRLIIVCDEGIAIQKLLLKQCQRYLPKQTIEAVFTTEQFNSVRDLITADLLISTTDALDAKQPTLVVHPILTDADTVRLLRFVRQQGRDNHQDLRQQLDRYIKHYVKDDKSAYVLRSKIEQLIHRELLLEAVHES